MTPTGAPPSWSQVRLLGLVSIRNGQVDPRDPRYRDLPLIAPDHIAPRTGRLLAKESAAAQGAISGKYLVEPGDVIYSKIRPYLRKAYKCDFRALCSADMYPFTPRVGVSGSFILHTVLGRDFTNFAISVSARSGIPKINRVELSEFELLAPRSSIEQEAIGSYLDDADDLIAMLERLIAKQKAIKQGMMQQLLTGRTRLPGYRANWIPRRLASVLDKLEAGVSVNSISGPGQYSVLKTSCVSGGAFDPSECKTVAPSDLKKVKLSPQADSLIISRMNTPALVGEVGYIDTDWPTLFLPDRLWLATKRSTHLEDMRWLGYVLSSGQYREQLRKIATGTSGSMKNVSRGAFRQLSVPYPPVEEQIAIARVLLDVDVEIRALRARLDKARAIKQGMMQQLLTGHTRLPLQETAS